MSHFSMRNTTRGLIYFQCNLTQVPMLFYTYTHRNLRLRDLLYPVRLLLRRGRRQRHGQVFGPRPPARGPADRAGSAVWAVFTVGEHRAPVIVLVRGAHDWAGGTLRTAEGSGHFNGICIFF